ncbi:uncharacterized protein LOC127643739 [Xyrauchen texanus]|uniref:uncharacterized protein LOC127643739 n=1 Tax=Xyrauchen texanus TaxID=154827 RepID=UPI002241B988|nr:uncharacterized protein LOC127643739 [Xyrauchen texanus]
MAADDLQQQNKKQLENEGKELMTDDSNQRYEHKYLTEVIVLAHNLTGLKQEVNNLKRQITESQTELTHAKNRIDQLEMEAQDRHKDPGRRESQEVIHRLQTALTAAKQQEQLEKTAREHLEKVLFHKDSLLKTANSELLDKDARIMACEGQLNVSRAGVKVLTQQLDNTKDELDMVQRELRHSYLLQKEPQQERHLTPPLAISRETSPSQAQIYKGRRQTPMLNTSSDSFLKASAAAEGKGLIQTNLETTRVATLKDLNRMARHIPAFTPELAGDHDVHAYLRDIDFHLQSLMSVNHQDRLHLIWITSSPELRRFLARQPENIQSNYQQLKQAIIREFSESKNGLIAALDTKQGRHETPYVYYHRLRRAYFGARNKPGMEEDTSFKCLFLQNLHPMVSHHLGIMACPHTMPIQQLRDLTQKAFNKHKASPSEHHRTSHSSLQQHPPVHLSNRCQTEAAQRQLETPVTELQELLALAKELLEQNSPEEYWEEQTSDSCPTPLRQAQVSTAARAE